FRGKAGPQQMAGSRAYSLLSAVFLRCFHVVSPNSWDVDFRVLYLPHCENPGLGYASDHRRSSIWLSDAPDSSVPFACAGFPGLSGLGRRVQRTIMAECNPAFPLRHGRRLAVDDSQLRSIQMLYPGLCQLWL